jgi:hypothetical protein
MDVITAGGATVNTMTINITVDSFKHIQCVLDGMVMGMPPGTPPPNGAIMGRPAGVMINPKVRELVLALYHVLSGGQVTPGAWPPVAGTPGTLTITAGTAASVTGLTTMEASCLASINTVNGTVNYEIVLPV